MEKVLKAWSDKYMETETILEQKKKEYIEKGKYIIEEEDIIYILPVMGGG